MVAGSLAACTPSAPTPTRTPVATHSQAFASDADALKAATEAYAAYLKMSDTIAQEGGVNPERIKPFVTGDALESSMESARQYRDAKAHSTGTTTFTNATLEQASYSRHPLTIRFYVCSDVSRTDVVTVDGKSLVAENRQPRTTFEIEVVGRGEALVVASRIQWTGSSVCE